MDSPGIDIYHLSWYNLSTIVISIVRLATLIELTYATVNATWKYICIMMWSSIELSVCIICVSLPSFRQLLVKCWLGMLRNTVNPNGSYQIEPGSHGWEFQGRNGGSYRSRINSIHLYQVGDDLMQRSSTVGSIETVEVVHAQVKHNPDEERLAPWRIRNILDIESSPKAEAKLKLEVVRRNLLENRNIFWTFVSLWLCEGHQRLLVISHIRLLRSW